MEENFIPVPVLELYCRFCKKTLPAQLERCIADSGKIVDKDSTFEYVCPHCHRPHCFYGRDLMERPKESDEFSIDLTPRDYKVTERFVIGERIRHPSYKTPGKIVGKYPGVPNRLVVKFEKNITVLVEDISKMKH